MKIITLAVLSALAFSSHSYASDLPSLGDAVTQHKSLTTHNALWLLWPDKQIQTVNANQLLIPASTQKLLVTTAAVLALAPDVSFDTELTVTGSLENHVLNGNIHINYSGDPSFSLDKLHQLLSELSRLGIKHIAGDIILSHQQLHLPSYPDERASGWLWDELSICYAAPVSAFNINGNCQQASLSAAGLSSSITAIAPNILELTSTAQFSDNAECVLRASQIGVNKTQLSGCINTSSTVNLRLAIDSPQAANQALIRQWLIAQKITLNGDIRARQLHEESQATSVEFTTGNTSLIAKKIMPSRNLLELIQQCLLDSNNLIADSLLKQLGQKTYQEWSFAAGVKAMVSILQDAGITLDGASFEDGSGLSRYNQMTAAQLGQVLQLINSDPKLAVIKRSLPIAGKSGTLRYKSGFTKEPLAGVVEAKTGGMAGVNNLAGYLTTPQGEVSFVILENGVPGTNAIKSQSFPNRRKEQAKPPAAYLPLAPTILKQVLQQSH
ncbi:MAG: D-alanyl-D-alanine carboxypeptidase/D-alanyl-D-alanine endopeptidase [Shewanella sp.]